MMAEQITREEVTEFLRSLLGPPDLFARLVDALERQELPQEPLIWTLKLWGAWHGFYSPERLLPPDHEEATELLARLWQHLPL
jgi:hypothetical protein